MKVAYLLSCSFLLHFFQSCNNQKTPVISNRPENTETLKSTKSSWVALKDSTETLDTPKQKTKSQKVDSLRKRENPPTKLYWKRPYPMNEYYLNKPEDRAHDSIYYFRPSLLQKYRALYDVRSGDSILWEKWQHVIMLKDSRHNKVPFKFIEK